MAALFAIFVVAIRAYTLDPQEVKDSEAIKECRKIENDVLLELSSRRFAREACDLLEQKYNDKYGNPP